MFGVAGSGKSTLLKLAIGLLRPDSGRIFVLGEEVTRMSEQELFELRRRVGIVFQESALFDSLKVYENVAFRLMEEGISAEEIESTSAGGASVRGVGANLRHVSFRAFRRHATPGGDCSRHHHDAGGTALRLADRRT